MQAKNAATLPVTINLGNPAITNPLEVFSYYCQSHSKAPQLFPLKPKRRIKLQHREIYIIGIRGIIIPRPSTKGCRVYSLELVLTAALGSVIAGIILGLFIAQRTSSSNNAQRQLEEQLSEMKEQQDHYQQEVSEHFMETAQLLNQLTNSYRDVHNHLAKGAQMLAGEGVGESLKALPDDKDTAPGRKTAESMLTPPLDYAPKTPDQPGMLNEEFGINKSRPAVEEEDDDYATEQGRR